MREVVFINLGQAGVQMSNAVWELFCTEHGVGCNGVPTTEEKDTNSESFKSIFHEIPNGQYVPRVVTIDLEPTVIDEVRTGNYRNLFHPDQLISGIEDASNNYARGHFTIGRRLIDRSINQIRKVVQICDNFQGFFLINSLAGGTGSGFSTLLGEKLCIDYMKRPKFQVCVYPSPKLESSVVSPYNTVMNAYSSTDYINLSMIMDNEALFDIVSESLNILRPTFTNLNRLVSQVLSSLTISLRFENCLNNDLDQLCTNLIPYPRIHFPMTQYAPIESQQRAEHEKVDEFELTRSVFSPKNQFIKINVQMGKMMSCVMQYRGNVSPKKANQAIFAIKRRNDINFVDWCPTGFKVGINSFPPVIVPNSAMAQTTRSVAMLSNNTAIAQMWMNLMVKFDLLYVKRSFVYWFVGEGMEEGEFSDARDNLLSIIKDYNEVGISTEDYHTEETIRDINHPPQLKVPEMAPTYIQRDANPHEEEEAQQPNQQFQQQEYDQQFQQQPEQIPNQQFQQQEPQQQKNLQPAPIRESVRRNSRQASLRISQRYQPATQPENAYGLDKVVSGESIPGYMMEGLDPPY